MYPRLRLGRGRADELMNLAMAGPDRILDVYKRPKDYLAYSTPLQYNPDPYDPSNHMLVRQAVQQISDLALYGWYMTWPGLEWFE